MYYLLKLLYKLVPQDTTITTSEEKFLLSTYFYLKGILNIDILTGEISLSQLDKNETIYVAIIGLIRAVLREFDSTKYEKELFDIQNVLEVSPYSKEDISIFAMKYGLAMNAYEISKVIVFHIRKYYKPPSLYEEQRNKNFLQASEYINRLLMQKRDLSIFDLILVNKILTYNTVHNQICGQLRDYDGFILNTNRIPLIEVDNLLDEYEFLTAWINKVIKNKTKRISTVDDLAKYLAVILVHFDHLHPHKDANSRESLLLCNYFCHKLGFKYSIRASTELEYVSSVYEAMNEALRVDYSSIESLFSNHRLNRMVTWVKTYLKPTEANPQIYTVNITLLNNLISEIPKNIMLYKINKSSKKQSLRDFYTRRIVGTEKKYALNAELERNSCKSFSIWNLSIPNLDTKIYQIFSDDYLPKYILDSKTLYKFKEKFHIQKLDFQSFNFSYNPTSEFEIEIRKKFVNYIVQNVTKIIIYLYRNTKIFDKKILRLYVYGGKTLSPFTTELLIYTNNLLNKEKIPITLLMGNSKDFACIEGLRILAVKDGEEKFHLMDFGSSFLKYRLYDSIYLRNEPKDQKKEKIPDHIKYPINWRTIELKKRIRRMEGDHNLFGKIILYYHHKKILKYIVNEILEVSKNSSINTFYISFAAEVSGSDFGDVGLYRNLSKNILMGEEILNKITTLQNRQLKIKFFHDMYAISQQSQSRYFINWGTSFDLGVTDSNFSLNKNNEITFLTQDKKYNKMVLINSKPNYFLSEIIKIDSNIHTEIINENSSVGKGSMNGLVFTLSNSKFVNERGSKLIVFAAGKGSRMQNIQDNTDRYGKYGAKLGNNYLGNLAIQAHSPLFDIFNNDSWIFITGCDVVPFISTYSIQMFRNYASHDVDLIMFGKSELLNKINRKFSLIDRLFFAIENLFHNVVPIKLILKKRRKKLGLTNSADGEFFYTIIVKQSLIVEISQMFKNFKANVSYDVDLDIYQFLRLPLILSQTQWLLDWKREYGVAFDNWKKYYSDIQSIIEKRKIVVIDFSDAHYNVNTPFDKKRLLDFYSEWNNC